MSTHVKEIAHRLHGVGQEAGDLVHHVADVIDDTASGVVDAARSGVSEMLPRRRTHPLRNVLVVLVCLGLLVAARRAAQRNQP